MLSQFSKIAHDNWDVFIAIHGLTHCFSVFLKGDRISYSGKFPRLSFLDHLWDAHALQDWHHYSTSCPNLFLFKRS